MIKLRLSAIPDDRRSRSQPNYPPPFTAISSPMPNCSVVRRARASLIQQSSLHRCWRDSWRQIGRSAEPGKV
jgi:hypothetical protein